MKEILQQAKEILEYTYDHPDSRGLGQCIDMLEQAAANAGGKREMLDNVITAVIQAHHAQRELEISGDASSSSAFGEAFNALDQAIESYS